MGAVEQLSAGSSQRKRQPIGRLHLALVMCGLVLLGGCNFVLLKVTYTAYGDRRAFFVNQAINLLYIGYGGLMLYPRLCFTNQITAEMQRFPKKHFFAMGVLDSLGTFFTCLGAAYTPGSLTPLLNQLLIPFTMSVSVVYLRSRYARAEIFGAVLIVGGACFSVLPDLVVKSSASSMEARWYAVLFYAMSNCPMAMSAVYKEGTFEEKVLDVWYLTQWVSIFQFLVSFAYMPLLVLPGFSSPDGMSMREVQSAFIDGLHCYFEQVPECAEGNAFWLLTGYCGVNVCFNTLGLYLTKHGSAVLQALSYSILLPFTTALFFTPLLGQYQEPLSWRGGFTLGGLLLTLCGFGIYQRHARNVGDTTDAAPHPSEAARATPVEPAPLLATPLLAVGAVGTALCEPQVFATEEEGTQQGQPSFQERVIGMGHACGHYASRRATDMDGPNIYSEIER